MVYAVSLAGTVAMDEPLSSGESIGERSTRTIETKVASGGDFIGFAHGEEVADWTDDRDAPLSGAGPGDCSPTPAS